MNISNETAVVDINAGLAFERARARLNQDAGQAFRKYMLAKNDPKASASAIDVARAAYIEANNEYRSLRPGHAEAIALILGGGR